MLQFFSLRDDSFKPQLAATEFELLGAALAKQIRDSNAMPHLKCAMLAADAQVTPADFIGDLASKIRALDRDGHGVLRLEDAFAIGDGKATFSDLDAAASLEIGTQVTGDISRLFQVSASCMRASSFPLLQ